MARKCIVSVDIKTWPKIHGRTFCVKCKCTRDHSCLCFKDVPECLTSRYSDSYLCLSMKVFSHYYIDIVWLFCNLPVCVVMMVEVCVCSNDHDLGAVPCFGIFKANNNVNLTSVAVLHRSGTDILKTLPILEMKKELIIKVLN